MGDSAALVERMSTAVRTAYKAIEVLKEENKVLKAENETLKLQIQALMGSQQPGTDDLSDECTPDASPITSPVALHTARIPFTTTLKPLQLSKPVSTKLEPAQPAQQLPLKAAKVKSSAVDTYIPVIDKSSLLVEEYGLNKPSCSTNFGNSPEAKKIIVFLKELTLQNVHVLAKSIAPVSMDTISKAVMFTITSYITTEVLTSWEKPFSPGASLGSPTQLLPYSLLTQLDLLGNLVVSLASRASNGMIRASKLMAIVKKVILGAIRCQWMSPHYALVMGTLRSHRVAIHHTADASTHSSDDHSVIANQVDELGAKIKHEAVHAADGELEHMDIGLEAHDAGSDAEESEDLDSRGHDGVPDEALSSESEAEEEEEEIENEPLSNPVARPSLAAWGRANRSAAPSSHINDNNGVTGATVVPQSARKAVLSSMFGLDDSSEDEGDEHEMADVKEENDEEDDVFMTNDNDLDVDDSDAVVTPSDAREVQITSAQTELKPMEQTKFSAAGRSVVDHACKVYFLFSSLVRLVSFIIIFVCASSAFDTFCFRLFFVHRGWCTSWSVPCRRCASLLCTTCLPGR